MKMLILFIGTLLMSQNVLAQSAEQKIKQTLNHYIEGTSYNDPVRINKAFNSGAELFLDGRDDKLKVMKAEEYVALFSEHPTGRKNNRIGKILSLEVYGRTATAKVEIIMPNAELRFVDYFILKLVDNSWKITRKAASSKTSNLTGRRVLFVLSNAHFHGQSDLKAGNSFGEIVDAYDTFKQAGFTIDFVSPEGGAVPLAYINTSDSLQKRYLYHADFMYALEHSMAPDMLEAADFSAVYYVGGSSATYGVPENKGIQKLSMDIYNQQGVVASVCHGTTGLVNLKTTDGRYLLADKKVTGYPESFEKQDAAYFSQYPFLLQETIEQRQGQFLIGERNSEHVVVDGRLVTGQNYRSAKLVAKKAIDILSMANQ